MVSVSAMEKVLDEIKILKQRISAMRQNKVIVEDEINDI